MFTMNRDGSNVQPLPTNMCDIFQQPIWSPDGEHIALMISSKIGILSAKTGIVWDSHIQANYKPVWSSDGRQLAFVGTGAASAAPEVYVVNSDGSHLRALSKKAVLYNSPSWSPDNQELLIQTPDMNIYAAPLDGEKAWRLLGKSIEYPAASVWRPSK
jgi:TolB protein